MVRINKINLALIILLTFFLSACTTKQEPKKKIVIEEFKEKVEEKKRKRILASTPSLVLPEVYQEPCIDNCEDVINFSANDVPLSKLLFIISKEAGLNLIIDDSIDTNKTVTVNLVDTPIKNAFKVISDISDVHFNVVGNMLYVKKFQTKIFKVPFINMKIKTASSELGGDILGQSDTSGLSGLFKIEYEADSESNDFYGQFVQSLEKTLSPDGKYSLNKFSGTLQVTDLKSKVDEIEVMIDNINKFISKQVLIDAKIMEVVLNEQNQLGVNWENLWSVNGGRFSVNQGLSGNTNPAGGITNLMVPISNGATATSIAYSRNNFQGIISAMQTSGNIETVSNPRIKVLNGQTGILSSGSMEPYWEKKVTYSEIINDQNEKEYKPEVTYDRKDVLNGISLGVTAIIKDDGTVLLNIIPIITSIEGEKVFVDGENEVARAPIINVKEVGTTVVVRDNDMLVIGGLITSTKKDEVYKVPVLADIPAVGTLFQRHETIDQKRELVIILKINVEKTDI